MAITQCAIDLDAARYSPGDTLRGRFEFETDKETKCRKVYLIVGWHTSGRGDRDEEEVAKEIIQEGVIPCGKVSDEFECVLPEGPVSYTGYYINLHWFVRIHADIPWGFDFKEQAEFVLVAKAEEPPSPDF
ncbi:hypothetical protein ACFL54_07665 [Planctomycetota bacterium]